MIKKTTWSPDTCDCKIEYEWDSDVAEKDRTHSVSKILKVCDAHKNLVGDSAKYNQVLDENQRKNIVYGKIIDNITDVVDEKLVDGKTVKELKIGVNYGWSFDKDRNLVLDLTGFSSSNKTELENLISGDNKLKDKVIVN